MSTGAGKAGKRTDFGKWAGKAGKTYTFRCLEAGKAGKVYFGLYKIYLNFTSTNSCDLDNVCC